MNEFFDGGFFSLMGAMIRTYVPPGEETLAEEGRKLTRRRLQEIAGEYNRIFSDPGEADQQRIITREVQRIYADGGGESTLLRLFFVFFPETLAPIPMVL